MVQVPLITASDKNCGVWPAFGAFVGFCSRNGLAPKPSKVSYPYCKLPYGLTTVNGKPVCALKIPSTIHPRVRRLGAVVRNDAKGRVYSKLATNRCATL